MSVCVETKLTATDFSIKVSEGLSQLPGIFKRLKEEWAGIFNVWIVDIELGRPADAECLELAVGKGLSCKRKQTVLDPMEVRKRFVCGQRGFSRPNKGHLEALSSVTTVDELKCSAQSGTKSAPMEACGVSASLPLQVTNACYIPDARQPSGIIIEPRHHLCTLA